MECGWTSIATCLRVEWTIFASPCSRVHYALFGECHLHCIANTKISQECLATIVYCVDAAHVMYYHTNTSTFSNVCSRHCTIGIQQLLFLRASSILIRIPSHFSICKCFWILYHSAQWVLCTTFVMRTCLHCDGAVSISNRSIVRVLLPRCLSFESHINSTLLYIRICKVPVWSCWGRRRLPNTFAVVCCSVSKTDSCLLTT